MARPGFGGVDLASGLVFRKAWCGDRTDMVMGFSGCLDFVVRWTC